MRTFIYKRTHCGDPDPQGRFGIHGCMGKDRTWDFDAVIGVGGIGDEPVHHNLAGKVNWIGIGAHQSGAVDEKRGLPIIIFKKFLLFSPEGGEPARDFKDLARNLADRMLYKGNVRVLMDDLSTDEQLEVKAILALAKDADPSSADRARPMTTSGGCVHRPPSAKSIKGCSSRPAPRLAARTKC